ncbi:DUF788-domain-containing protein [Schizopora paradoxa]|uniref:DUF788-domain-containing protein n=1 Tax=Schizopora paradoxa TaxID=27342 RepID=A0A0H2RLS7_9AGAM|nr:DUF788-domain-containing protein [Schizopora paradoxa]
MANASQKRIASQNETAVRNLKLGALISIALTILFRLLLRRGILPQSKLALFVFVSTGGVEALLLRYLINIGTVKRDASNALVSAGEDLSQSGITEWCFDVVYITWLCQVSSSLFGERAWLLYLVIPLFACYKAWGFISPMLGLGRSSQSAAEESAPAGESKRQQKLRQRAEKGDPRVKQGKR